MKTSESTKNIMNAIHSVQQNAGTVSKATKGQVGTRTYRYANLIDTWDAVKGLMGREKLVVIQSPTIGDSDSGAVQTVGRNFFTTKIIHVESSEWIEETMEMILQRSDPQGIGAAITYYRRYMLTSMLGLIPDDDNDAKDHRLATAQQKQRLMGAVKQVWPEVTKPEDIVRTIQNICGKFPGNIREDEAEDMISLIKAFNTAKE